MTHGNLCLQKSHESSPYLQLPNVSQWLAKLVNIAPISCLGSLGVFCVSMCWNETHSATYKHFTWAHHSASDLRMEASFPFKPPWRPRVIFWWPNALRGCAGKSSMRGRASWWRWVTPGCTSGIEIVYQGNDDLTIYHIFNKWVLKWGWVTTYYETGDLPQIWGLDHCFHQGFLVVLDPPNGDRVDYTKAIPCHAGLAGLGWELANTARDRDFEKRMNLTGTFF